MRVSGQCTHPDKCMPCRPECFPPAGSDEEPGRITQPGVKRSPLPDANAGWPSSWQALGPCGPCLTLYPLVGQYQACACVLCACSVSSLAWFMSNQEGSFVTLGQRTLAVPLK